MTDGRSRRLRALDLHARLVWPLVEPPAFVFHFRAFWSAIVLRARGVMHSGGKVPPEGKLPKPPFKPLMESVESETEARPQRRWRRRRHTDASLAQQPSRIIDVADSSR